MKQLLIALILSIASWAAHAAPPVPINTNGLSPEQAASLRAKAAELVASNSGTTTSAVVRTEVAAWGELGANVGRAMVGAAKEMSMAAADFAKTPIGKATVAVIVYKAIGQDVIRVTARIALLVVWCGLLIWVLLTRRWSEVTYETRRFGPWQMFSRQVVMKTRTEDAVVGGRLAAGAVLVAAIGFTIASI